MALIKENLDFGISANYWRVINISIDIISNTSIIFISLYVSKDAKRSIDTRSFTVTNEDFERFFSKDGIKNFRDLYNASYLCLKELDPYFIDAVDDTEEIEYLSKNEEE